jgi:parallel beta-helix repeat protein
VSKREQLRIDSRLPFRAESTVHESDPVSPRRACHGAVLFLSSIGRMVVMEKLWWVFVPLASAVVGCATSVPVECPEGFVLTGDGTDCLRMEPPDEPDAGNVEPPLRCEDLDCDDDNECTDDGCADDSCLHVALEDGTACSFQGGAGLCEAGACIVDCTIEDCRPIYACTEQGIRDAIRDGGQVIIGCPVPTTVTLAEGVLVIDNGVSLDGLGNLTIDAGGQSRVFEVKPPAVAELVGMGITGGTSLSTEDGGGIVVREDAQLTIRECRIYGNVAGNHCGGLGNSGTVMISDSQITENLANRRGGGFCNNENLTIVDSSISDNLAVEDGGGIYSVSNGTTVLEHCTVSNNVANSLGGGIWTSGLLVTLEDSSVTDNQALEGAGIRVWTAAEVRVTDSLIARNVAAEAGGALTADEGRIWLVRSILTDNVATGGNGGGIEMDQSILDAVDTVFSHNVAEGGAAIYTRSSTVRLLRTTLLANQASIIGGAIRAFVRSATEYDVWLINSTVSGNSAVQKGGAIAIRTSAKVLLTHSTLHNNIAPLGSGLIAESGAAFEVGYSAIHDGCAGSEDAMFTSNGYNAMLALEAEACTFGGETDAMLTTGEMNLGALSELSGYTPTHVPGAGSLLIDAIPPDVCAGDILEDQRGELRGGGSACDIGAVEVQVSD